MSVEVGSNLMNSLSPQKVNEKLLNAVDNRSCTKPAAKVRHLTFSSESQPFIIIL